MLQVQEHRPTLPTKTSRPVIATLAWLATAVSVAASGFLVWVVVHVTSEWSGYEGGESSTALAITGFVAFMTLIFWLLTAAFFRISHR